MSTTHDSTRHGTELVGVCERILADSMTPLNDRAFERGKRAFDGVYRRVLACALRSADPEQAHDEAVTEGLQAFLAAYETETAR